jgi:hypothetical protein
MHAYCELKNFDLHLCDSQSLSSCPRVQVSRLTFSKSRSGGSFAFARIRYTLWICIPTTAPSYVKHPSHLIDLEAPQAMSFHTISTPLDSTFSSLGLECESKVEMICLDPKTGSSSLLDYLENLESHCR